MQLNINHLKQFLDYSLSEDLGIKGDITSRALILPSKNIKFSIINREPMILCGKAIIDYFFINYSNIKYEFHAKDGDYLEKNHVIVSGFGNCLELLALERTILNYLQHLSGVATLAHLYVLQVKDTNAKICDTRKTIPGLRALQKYATFCGGCINHRLSLDSSILVKDNHLAICGNITEILLKAKKEAPHYTKIEVECDNIKQVQEVLVCGIDIIMLDNMTITQIIEAVALIGNKAIIEVSGGVNLENVKQIAQTGVDFISVGKITNSVNAIDIGMDL
jgi:nicotinate-nucleotide pyrophosphorylase (carboxylating)